jgi:broad specificity phosphatase PhoE
MPIKFQPHRSPRPTGDKRLGHVYFITHPEVVIDPAVAVPKWGLSETGRERMVNFCAAPFVKNFGSIFCSDETKAKEAAAILAQVCNLAPIIIDTLGENDRSATGVLPKDVFETAANEFFARPDVSYKGWETATDAQARIIGAVDNVLKRASSDGDIAIVSHGGVGTLYKCNLKHILITRTEDQPRQGHYYVFDAITKKLMQDWEPIA